MHLVTNRNAAILLAPERWRESQFLEDKVHMMTHYLKQSPVTAVFSQIALMCLKSRKKKKSEQKNQV